MIETIKSTPSLEVLKIAKTCHQAKKAWFDSNGYEIHEDWDELDWLNSNQRQNTIAEVNFRLENPNSGYDAQHNAWLEEKKKEGWIYGDVMDREAKTYPFIVPFEELPEFQKKKYALFCAIVDALKD